MLTGCRIPTQTQTCRKCLFENTGYDYLNKFETQLYIMQCIACLNKYNTLYFKIEELYKNCHAAIREDPKPKEKVVREKTKVKRLVKSNLPVIALAQKLHGLQSVLCRLYKAKCFVVQ